MTHVDFMLRIWGYAVIGPASDEARVCEGLLSDKVMWDSTNQDLDSIRFGLRKTKPMFALWWVCEHVRRGHAELA